LRGAFTPATNERLIDALVRLAGFPADARVADLGCGSGVFTNVLQRSRHRCIGIDLSSKPIAIAIARSKFPNIEFIEGGCRTVAVFSECAGSSAK
jgi:ubiquinone/menaquinone biosynthesis C-methylase UbiE